MIKIILIIAFMVNGTPHVAEMEMPTVSDCWLMVKNVSEGAYAEMSQGETAFSMVEANCAIVRDERAS
mgnify:CR=1 FL=1